MTWDLRVNGSVSAGGAVLPGVAAQRGAAIGRTGLVPRAGRLGATLDADLIDVGDRVELLDDTDVVWTGRVRDVRQTVDRSLNALRWRIAAAGPIADLVAIEGGASTRWHQDILAHDAVRAVMAAIGWADSTFTVGESTRTLAHWRLSAGEAPWAALLRIMRTDGPDARVDETAAGLLAFRFGAAPARSRTLYSNLQGTGARAIVSRLDGEDAGLDRVLNRAVVPTVFTPSAGTPTLDRVEWGVSAPDAPDAFARIRRDRLALEPGETALVVLAAAAYVSAPAQIPQPDAPSIMVLHAETWETVHGAGAVPRQTDTTVNTPDSAVEAWIGNPPSARLWRVGARGDSDSQGGPAAAWVRDQAGGATADIAIPAGAMGVRAELTQLRAHRAELTYDAAATDPIGGDGGGDGTLVDLADAGDHVQIEISGPRLNVVPRAGQGRQQFRNAADAEGAVYAYDATVRLNWTEIDAPRTWAALTAGIAQSEGSDVIEVATRVGDVADAVERTSAAVAALVLSGGSPRVIEGGAIVDPDTLLLSLAVVEGGLDADAVVDIPEGWTPIAGEPLANVADAPRRVLWGAWQRVAARGAVTAPTWAVSGPQNALARTLLVAVDPERAIVWSDPERERVIGAGATETIDVRIDAPIVDVTAPVPGLDFAVREGAIASVAVDSTVAGVAARITITAGADGATIAELVLRGVPVVAGADAVIEDGDSIRDGLAAARLDVAPLGSVQATELARAEVLARARPRAAWGVELHGARNAETRAAARGVELGDVVLVDLDTALRRDGEIMSIEHHVESAAALLRTRLEMLQLPTSHAAVPSAPRSLAAVSFVTDTALVTWAPPASDGNAAITGYRLEYRTGSDAWTPVTLGDVDQHTITGLTASTTYQVRVAAINRVGTGAFAGTVSVTTEAPATVPAQVTGLTLLAGTPPSTVVVASWDAPDDGGAAIIAYEYRYGLAGSAVSGWTALTTLGARTVNITDLTHSTAYDVQVRARNGVGVGPWSAVENITTAGLAATVPGQPAAPTAAAGTDALTEIDVSWAAPASNGGAAISGYDLRHRAVGATTWTEVDVGNVVGRTVSGLTAGTSYEFAVRARNSVGDGAWSDSTTHATALAAPGVPTNLAAATAGENGLAVSWGAPATGGAVATYELRYRPGTTGTWTESAGLTGTSAGLIALTPGTTYQVEVRARNAAGVSAWVRTTGTTAGTPPPVTGEIEFAVEGHALEVEGHALTRGTET